MDIFVNKHGLVLTWIWPRRKPELETEVVSMSTYLRNVDAEEVAGKSWGSWVT